MFRAFLVGAGLAAILDSILALPIQGVTGLRLEYLEWAIWGTMSIAIFMAVVLKLLGAQFASRKIFARLQNGQAFWAGLLMGLIPIAAVQWPVLGFGQLHRVFCLAFWTLPVFALLLVAPPVPRALRSGSKLLTPLALLAPILGLFAYGYSAIQEHGVKPAPQLPATSLTASAADGRPDLLLISVDTLRTDLTRGSVELLPVLGELRKEGLWAELCLSTSNQTVPGHVGMLTGLEPDQHTAAQNSEMKSIPDAALLQKHLQESGYRTAGVISNAMVKDFGSHFEAFDDTRADYGPRFHFMRVAGSVTWFSKVIGLRKATGMVEHWLNITDNVTLPAGMSAYTTDSALQYLDALTEAGEAPYHLFVHYMDAHSPYSPPEETLGKFSNPEDLPAALKPFRTDHRRLINQIRFGLAEDENRATALQAAQHMRDLYDEEVLYLDGQLRRLIQAVRDKGRPTLMVLTSDHGELFGEHNLVEHSTSLYRELTNVPFVMVGLNGFEVPMQKLDSILSLTDIVPTFTAAAKAPKGNVILSNLRGVNLLSEKAPAKLNERIHLLAWRGRNLLTVAAQSTRWKVVGSFEPIKGSTDAPKLQRLQVFDLSADPVEAVNLLDQDLPEEVDELWGRLMGAGFRWEQMGMFEEKENDLDGAEQAMMDALGYTDVGKKSDVESKAASGS